MKSLNDLTKYISTWAKNETVKMQKDLFAGIQEDTPVKTGRAQAGWESTDITKMGNTGIVKNDVDYIGWLEFGTDTMQPFGMVRNNIKRVVGK